MAIYAPNTRLAQARRARSRRVVLMALVFAVVAVVAPKAVATDASTPPVQLDTYTVGSGESLWSIAANLTPEGRDVRDTMEAIQRLNVMSGSQLQAGEQLLIPAID